jgi:hypothetical protein
VGQATSEPRAMQDLGPVGSNGPVILTQTEDVTTLGEEQVPPGVELTLTAFIETTELPA